MRHFRYEASVRRNAIVEENQYAIGCKPDVGLQPVNSSFQCSLKSIVRVFVSFFATSTVTQDQHAGPFQTNIRVTAAMVALRDALAAVAAMTSSTYQMPSPPDCSLASLGSVPKRLRLD